MELELRSSEDQFIRFFLDADIIESSEEIIFSMKGELDGLSFYLPNVEIGFSNLKEYYEDLLKYRNGNEGEAKLSFGLPGVYMKFYKEGGERLEKGKYVNNIVEIEIDNSISSSWELKSDFIITSFDIFMKQFKLVINKLDKIFGN